MNTRVYQRGNGTAAFVWLGAAVVSILLALGMVATIEPTIARAESSGCTLTPTNGTVQRTVDSPILGAGGFVIPGKRIYNINVPSGLSGEVPLLIANHGLSSNAENLEKGTGWTDYARDHQFIVVYTQSLIKNPIFVPGIGWPGNFWFVNKHSVDVAYLKNVVADVEKLWCVDKTRVYSTGHSNGSILAQRMACDTADIFAAVTSWEGSDPSFSSADAMSSSQVSPCLPSRPIAVGIFQGENDPYSTSPVGRENIKQWTQRNGCPTTPTSTTTDIYGTLEQYAPCKAGITEIWRVMFGVAHAWPSGAAARDLLDRQWNYLTTYTLPA